MQSLGLIPRFSKLALNNEKELILKVPWGKLTALCWGEPSDPPVFLCQGRLDSCSSFRPLVQRLPSQYFYVSVDLPGNGKSDHYPRSGALHVIDFVPPIEKIIDHFKWNKFTWVGHSLGAAIGKVLNQLQPGQITRMVDVDPEPAYLPRLNDLSFWYKDYCSVKFCGADDHYKLKLGPETAPKYTYEDVRNKMMKARGASEHIVEHVLERCLEQTDDGLYRLTFDQRFKFLLLPTFLYDSLHEFYTSPKTPTLGIFATESIARNCYKAFPFALDDKAWRHGNYRHIVLEGGHDLHLQKPEDLAEHIATFLKDNPEKIVAK
ncbi:unnamed protein product [Diatraea saccharalis]|uniref:AB hydrolase-1 domain-containing protein n=1 Tax=Diatraea saccharalis TaxID=40085 RepID=A0A9N9R4Z3_9NEOP|nr:unnamed protein product [Diatraea saccharalis]